MKNTRKMSTETMVFGAILTALVIVLQYVSMAIRFGTFSISLVLVPIVVGAAICGSLSGAWLGLVFGIIVLVSGDAAPFLAIDPFGTVLTVIVKGTLAGLASGLVYKFLEKKNKYVAVFSSAIVCPIVNTGIFLLGCLVFFMDTIAEWAAAAGFANAGSYMILGLAGGNFLFELLFNICLGPIIVTLINLAPKLANKRK